MRIALGVLVLLTACDGNPDDNYQISGYSMETFFPFDGARTWEFTSDDAAETHYTIATLDPEAEFQEDGTALHEVKYDRVCIDPNDDTCEDAYVRTLVWSVSQSDGIAIRELYTPDGDVVFDEPVFLASDEMQVGDTVTSGAWTSTFVEIVPCPVLWTDDWDTCAHLQLTGGEGLANTNLAGSYYAVSNFNMVSFKLDSEPDQWRLSDASFEPTR